MPNQFAGHFTPFNVNRIIYSGTKIPKDFYPHEVPLMRWLLWRLKHNQNSFVCIVGSPRTGKSYFALWIMERYFKIFGIKDKVIDHTSFDIKPFLYWSQNHDNNIYLLDEIQANLSPQEWFTVLAKVFTVFTQTQGFRKNIVIMTLPNIAFILKNIRFMITYLCETEYQGKVWIRQVKASHALGKFRLPVNHNMRFKLSGINDATIKDYEALKKEWNDNRLKSDINWLEMLERPSEMELKKQKYFDLRTKKLELDVKAKENRLNRQNDPYLDM